MSFFHYFSNDAGKRARFIFDFIAPVYGWIEKHQVEHYNRAIEALDNEIGIRGKRVLDVGTGTGAWAGMFMAKGAKQVWGVDLSPKMMKEGKRKFPDIRFMAGDAENLTGIEDNSFDIVTASFVLHGVKAGGRRKMLSEMKRVTRGYVVVHDYSGPTHWAVGFIEAMERSDFRNFKAGFGEELKDMFQQSKKLDTAPGNGLYIGWK